MATAKKSPSQKSSAKESAKKSPSKGNPCWPGFEPGKHSTATKKATSKAAAASKLEKAGKPNPKAAKK